MNVNVPTDAPPARNFHNFKQTQRKWDVSNWTAAGDVRWPLQKRSAAAVRRVRYRRQDHTIGHVSERSLEDEFDDLVTARAVLVDKWSVRSFGVSGQRKFDSFAMVCSVIAISLGSALLAYRPLPFTGRTIAAAIPVATFAMLAAVKLRLSRLRAKIARFDAAIWAADTASLPFACTVRNLARLDGLSAPDGRLVERLINPWWGKSRFCLLLFQVRSSARSGTPPAGLDVDLAAWQKMIERVCDHPALLEAAVAANLSVWGVTGRESDGCAEMMKALDRHLDALATDAAVEQIVIAMLGDRHDGLVFDQIVETAQAIAGSDPAV